MKNGYIKTAAATPYITVADCNANGNEIIRLIHEMEKEHVKVMSFYRCAFQKSWKII